MKAIPDETQQHVQTILIIHKADKSHEPLSLVEGHILHRLDQLLPERWAELEPRIPRRDN